MMCHVCTTPRFIQLLHIISVCQFAVILIVVHLGHTAKKSCCCLSSDCCTLPMSALQISTLMPLVNCMCDLFPAGKVDSNLLGADQTQVQQAQPPYYKGYVAGHDAALHKSPIPVQGAQEVTALKSVLRLGIDLCDCTHVLCFLYWVIQQCAKHGWGRPA